MKISYKKTTAEKKKITPWHYYITSVLDVVKNANKLCINRFLDICSWKKIKYKCKLKLQSSSFQHSF